MTNRPRWKTILLAALCLIGLIAAIGGSYAAYTSQTFQRGVVRNRNIDMVRFASNYLQSCASGSEEKDYKGRTVYFPENSKEKDTVSLDLYVYNHVNGNNTIVSLKDITYTLKIQFRDGETGATYTVDYDGGREQGKEIVIENRILQGRSQNEHKYTITIPASDLDKVRIIATAVPTNLSATNNQILAAVIAPCTGSSTNEFSYIGEFIHSNEATPIEYDGFNYEIAISSGVANGTLSWKTGVVEIDKYFLKNLGKNDQEIADILNKGSIEITMDQSSGTGDYLIPFYIKDKSQIPDNWTNMDEQKIISFSAEQIQKAA